MWALRGQFGSAFGHVAAGAHAFAVVGSVRVRAPSDFVPGDVLRPPVQGRQWASSQV